MLGPQFAQTDLGSIAAVFILERVLALFLHYTGAAPPRLKR